MRRPSLFRSPNSFWPLAARRTVLVASMASLPFCGTASRGLEGGGEAVGVGVANPQDGNNASNPNDATGQQPNKPATPLPDAVHTAHPSRAIAYVAAWPKIPSSATGAWPPHNWTQASQQYHALLFNEKATGTYLPLVAFNANVVAIPSYVGDAVSHTSGGEALSVLGGLVGGSMAGFDLRNYNGRNWLATVAGYTAQAGGSRIVMNNRGSSANPATAWYSLFPTVLAAQLAHIYRGDPSYDLTPLMLEAATLWGTALPQLSNNWDHTGFNFTATPPAVTDLGWVEPDMAIGIAYLAETGFEASGQKRDDLNQLASTCLAQMDARQKNPFYEVLGYYGPLLAARRNALRGGKHDVDHFLNFVFASSGDARPIWGMNARRWGSYDAYGLMGEVTNNATQLGYAFSMNTYTAAAALAPVARYMPGYARALGRYLLHVASNGKMFLPAQMPQGTQDDYPVYDQTRALGLVTYESMRGWPDKEPTATGDSQKPRTHLTPYGSWSMGYLGAMFSATSHAAVLRTDLLATDFWHPEAHPSFLYYNPTTAGVTVDVPVAAGKTVDFVDTVTGRTLSRNVTGSGKLQLAADTAVVLVMPPANAALKKQGTTTYLGGVAVDFGLN